MRYRGIRVGKVSVTFVSIRTTTAISGHHLLNDNVPLTTGTVGKLNYQGVTGLAHILLLETTADASPLGNDESPPRAR